MKDFVIQKDKRFLAERVGDMSQLCGQKRYYFADGKAKGVEAVDVSTGTGFQYTVLPGRGLDIGSLSYKGVAVALMSKTKIVAPEFYEPTGMDWMRGFFGGMLTTCGLSNVGGPCEEPDRLAGTRKHGLHGRISNTPAENVCVTEGWKDGVYEMSVSGRVVESCFKDENLMLTREIKTFMGENRLIIRDSVENRGMFDEPLMLLYHCNFGYPLLDGGSRIVVNSEITPNDEDSKAKMDTCLEITDPQPGIDENLYFHNIKADSEGKASIALVNDKLEMGAYIRFEKEKLPYVTEWKQLTQQDYALGLEPGNCKPWGRTRLRENGLLKTIKAGEILNFEVEIGILTNKEEIEAFTQEIQAL